MVDKDYHKRYYIDNKQKLTEYHKQKVKCDVCGSEYVRSHKTNHISTKKHQAALKGKGIVQDEVTLEMIMDQYRRIEDILRSFIDE